MSSNSIEVTQDNTIVEVTQVPSVNLTVTQPAPLSVEVATGGIQGASGPAPTLNAAIPVTVVGPAIAPSASLTGSDPYTINLTLPSAAQILQGATAPSGGTGLQGYWYINTATWDMYEKTAVSTWTNRLNIRGATGPTPTFNSGVTVTPIAPTASPTASLSGSNPYTLLLSLPTAAVHRQGDDATRTSGLGLQGDTYTVTTGATNLGNTYIKTSSTVWTLTGNIRGAAGTGNVSSGAAVIGNVVTYGATDGSLITDSGFLATDVARLSQSQTFTGAKTFSNSVIISAANQRLTLQHTSNVADGVLLVNTTQNSSPRLLFQNNEVALANAIYRGPGALIVTTGGTAGVSSGAGTFQFQDTGVFLAPSFSGVGSSLTALNATQLTTGTIPLARLGTGGSTGTHTFLRGDQSWTNTLSFPSAANDTRNLTFVLNAGTDGTLGPIQTYIGHFPSATAANRYGFIAVGDSLAVRPLILNGLGTANLFGSVGVGTYTIASTASFNVVPINASSRGIVITGKNSVVSITNKALTSNVATLTTSTAHGFVIGKQITVASVDSTFNGTFDVASTPTTTTFTYAVTAADVASTAATGTATGDVQTGDLFRIERGNATALLTMNAVGTITTPVNLSAALNIGLNANMATFTHTANVAEGVVLKQTAVGGDSPRLFFLRNGDSSGNAIVRLSGGLSFTTSAIPGSATGTTRVAIADTGGVSSSSSFSSSSGVDNALVINQTLTQSSTAGYRGIQLNVVETSVGSGVKRLVDLTVGGVSRLYVENSGRIYNSTVSSTDYIHSSSVPGDTFTRWAIRSDGYTVWGPGNASTDVTLQRSGVGQLNLIGTLSIGSTGTPVNGGFIVNTDNVSNTPAIAVVNPAAAANNVGSRIAFQGTTGSLSQAYIASSWTGSATTDARMEFVVRSGNALPVLMTLVGTTVTVAGTMAATTFTGSGASLTGITISQVSGVVPIAQIPTGTSGTTVAFGNHGHALTDANITGILPIAQIPTGTSGTTVALGNHTHSLSVLTDVTITSPSAGNLLGYNGSAWVNATPVIANITGLQTALDAKAPLASPAFTGTVTGITAAMVGLGNVTNAAQVELTGAQTVAGIKTFSSPPLLSSLTASTVLVLDGSKNMASSSVTGTELGYVSGVTSAIQTQLNAKAPLVRTVNAQTGTTYTLVLADATAIVTVSNTSAVTLTVPPNSSVAIPIGSEIPIINKNTGDLTIAAGAGVTINATPGLKVTDQYGAASLLKIGTDEWVAVGRLSA